MRPLYVLILACVLLYMSQLCVGFGKNWTRINRHQEVCKPYLALTGPNGLKKRAADAQEAMRRKNVGGRRNDRRRLRD
ncbi:hypothetical protein OH77DRAFT_231821 [Trametes cingulata]|nr:hypothetical protein OH77DRAFT_231821 [Trametes cingulata]